MYVFGAFSFRSPEGDNRIAWISRRLVSVITLVLTEIFLVVAIFGRGEDSVSPELSPMPRKPANNAVCIGRSAYAASRIPVVPQKTGCTLRMEEERNARFKF